MPLPLTARTEAGGRLVALAESLVEELAGRAADHDRDGSFPFASADRLAELGYYAAPIAREYGGMGGGGLHDVIVASSRLGRGGAALAIGGDMHKAAPLDIGPPGRDAPRPPPAK